jgi:hypothetical protein
MVVRAISHQSNVWGSLVYVFMILEAVFELLILSMVTQVVCQLVRGK